MLSTTVHGQLFKKPWHGLEVGACSMPVLITSPKVDMTYLDFSEEHAGLIAFQVIWCAHMSLTTQI